jgi:hypothetical protein
LILNTLLSERQKSIDSVKLPLNVSFSTAQASPALWYNCHNHLHYLGSNAKEYKLPQFLCVA